MSTKECVICGSVEADGELLVAAPCRVHWVCPDDVSAFFERATDSESLFPPKCCGQIFMLSEYEEHVPFDVAWQYQVKEQGEYSVLAKFRVYCGNPSCTEFLQPSSHVTDPLTSISYATCSSGSCGKMTCTGCRALLLNGTEGHICQKDENEAKFRQTATEKGYQQCEMCGATVELTEACNHMTCGCGNDFCYICGKVWSGIHGCPRYGPAIYDEESYNQDGFHRDTGLNREGLTRRQESARLGDVDDEDDEDDDDEERGEDWDVMQHLEPEQRITINFLQGVARVDALDQLRMMLFETRGILFGLGDDGSEDSEHDNEEENEDSDETADGGSDGASEHGNGGPVTPNAPHLEAAPHDNAGLYSDGAAPHPTSLFGPGPSNGPRLIDPPLTGSSITTLSALRPSEPSFPAPSTSPLAPSSHTLDTANPMPLSPGSGPHAGAGTGSSIESPATETEDAGPVTPEDGEVVENAGKENGKRGMWGPPGGWPESDDGLL